MSFLSSKGFFSSESFSVVLVLQFVASLQELLEEDVKAFSVWVLTNNNFLLHLIEDCHWLISKSFINNVILFYVLMNLLRGTVIVSFLIHIYNVLKFSRT